MTAKLIAILALLSLNQCNKPKTEPKSVVVTLPAINYFLIFDLIYSRISCHVCTRKVEQYFALKTCKFIKILKKRCIIFFLSFLSLATVAAQKTTIRGVVQDESAHTLPFAAILLMQDSTLISTFQTEDDGQFHLSTDATDSIFILKITYVGYEKFEQKITISSSNTDTLNLGSIKMIPLSIRLAEAIVSAQRNPVDIRGDTLAFAASAFKTQPNALAEDLLKKMPSIEIERDGTIKAKGEDVKQILVNGKPFFGKDPRLALQSFPADAIQSVEVYEKKSDQTEFSGVDNGDREMTINIIIKPNFNRRTTGKAAAGIGSDGRYTSRASYNKFDETKKFTLLGAANNVNKAGFSSEDFLSFTTNNRKSVTPQQSAAAAQGFQSAQSGGANFIENWGKATEVNASYFYNNQETRNDRQLVRQNFLPTGSFTSRTTGFAKIQNGNHRLNGFIDQKLDSMTAFRLTTGFTFTDNSTLSNSDGTNRKGDTLRVSHSLKNGNTGGDGLGLSTNILLRRRFAKPRRTASINGSYSRNTADRSTFTDNKAEFFSPALQTIYRIDTVKQTDERENIRNNYAATASYTEPLSKYWLAELNYNFSTNDNEADREVFSLKTGEPILNTSLSNYYTSAFLSHRLGTSLRYNKRALNFSTGVQKQRSILRGSFVTRNQEVRQNFDYFLPNMRLNFNTSKTNRLEAFYETSVREPSIEQLQPLQDNADPFNVYVGNPDLQPEYTNRFRVGYTNFNKKSLAYFNGNMNLNLTENKIVNALSVDTLLRRTTQPLNIADGFMEVSLHTSMGFRFWQQKMRFNLTTNASQSRGTNPVNNTLNLTKRWRASAAPRLEFRWGDTFELSLKTVIRYDETQYSIQSALNQSFWIYEYEAEMIVGLPHDTRLTTSFDYTFYTSKTFGATKGIPLLNLTMSKFLDNRRFELRLAVIDVLNRNSGINRTADANYVQQETVRSLARYGLLTGIYSFNKGGKKEKKGKKMDRFERSDD